MKALLNFYNNEGKRGAIKKYKGNPKFIDLTKYKNFRVFENIAIKNFTKLRYNEHLKSITLEMGFDGIRYYDPTATGEEFVLYNTKKVKLISVIKNRKYLNSYFV